MNLCSCEPVRAHAFQEDCLCLQRDITAGRKRNVTEVSREKKAQHMPSKSKLVYNKLF